MGFPRPVIPRKKIELKNLFCFFTERYGSEKILSDILYAVKNKDVLKVHSRDSGFSEQKAHLKSAFRT